jgi:hypothetical protein
MLGSMLSSRRLLENCLSFDLGLHGPTSTRQLRHLLDLRNTAMQLVLGYALLSDLRLDLSRMKSTPGQTSHSTSEKAVLFAKILSNISLSEDNNAGWVKVPCLRG